MTGTKSKTSKRFSNDTIIEAFRRTNFNKGETAKILGISRQWLHKLIAQQEELRESLDAAQEFVLDKAEKVLEDLVASGNFQAVKFTLERLGKKRGYGNSIELTGDVSKPVTMISRDMTAEEAAKLYVETINSDVDNL